MKVIFIGGLSTGQVALDYLACNKYVSIPLIITKPIDVNGYNLNLEHFETQPCEVINDLNANNSLDKINQLSPDLIFVAGWSGLLSKQLIEKPKKGTIGFHPSLLPSDRGRSVLAWQIEEGYEETAVSMFYYNEIPDCGDIIAQEKIRIEKNDYINDVLNKCDNAIYNLMRAYFPLVRKGIAPRKPQNINEGNFRRLRDEKDSLINWDTNGDVIYNKIRAISRPYPGAYFIYKKKKIKIWESVFFKDKEHKGLDKIINVGTIKRLAKKLYLVRCKDGSIQIKTDVELDV